MKPTVYVDILPSSMTGKEASRVFGLLHGAFRTISDHKYALVLPGLYTKTPGKLKFGEDKRFERIRVFAESMAALCCLAEAVPGENFLFPKTVPEDFGGNWGVLARFQIPVRKKERHPERPVRMKRILQADEKNLPYFDVYSRTHEKAFRLYMELRPINRELVSEVGLPDSYGLSSSTRVVPLPLI